MINRKIADSLDLLADLLEFKGENAFKLRAYRNAARVIRQLTEDVESILDDPDRKLTDLDGIGKAVAEKCEALVRTGTMPQLEALKQELPASVLELLRIPGLGPKKAAVLYDQLGIVALDQLEAACREGRVRDLKGFGVKTEEAILKGIDLASRAGSRIYWSNADELAQRLRQHLSRCAAIEQLEFAGSYRRGKETVGDLDILAVSSDSAAVMDHLATFDEITSQVGRGTTKMSVRMEEGFQVDLRVVPGESFGAALQYFSGSKEHNVELRGRARQRGLKLNEWGVFQESGDEYLCGRTEEEVYKAVDLPWIPPELREARWEFTWAEADRLPNLITAADIVGDLHMHTDATDGQATLEEMVEAARDRGLKYIAITDHSKRVSMARGLDGERLLAQWKEIDRLNERLDGEFQVLKGIECDILEKGGMDLPDTVLEQADWVLASIHYGQQQPRQQITDRLLGAAAHPFVHAIAHPTGRLINRREPYEVDLNAIFDAVVEHRKLMELNANPARLDLNDVHCAAARERGIGIVINTDAHNVGGLDLMKYGVMQARRAGLAAGDVLNTLPLSEFRKRTARD